MKHIIIGGEGFLGQHLATGLVRMGQNVIVADIVRRRRPNDDKIGFVKLDVTDPASFDKLAIAADDVVYNLAARTPSVNVPRSRRRAYFWPVNYQGLKHILHWMDAAGAHKLVQVSTHLVYGRPAERPLSEDEAADPQCEYGRSKLAAESLCRKYSERGFSISILRPCAIVGPGREAEFRRLFKLVDMNLPIPMIGSGRNPRQFLSVFDFVGACIAVWNKGFPNKIYNLGSDNPPARRELLASLIREAGSLSMRVPTPAPLIKLVLGAFDRIDLPLMVPEDYLFADEHRILATEAARNDLDWRPRYCDEDMLIAMYADRYEPHGDRAQRTPGSRMRTHEAIEGR